MSFLGLILLNLKTVCWSGRRGWAQVPLAQPAWVQIPRLSIPKTSSCSIQRRSPCPSGADLWWKVCVCVCVCHLPSVSIDDGAATMKKAQQAPLQLQSSRAPQELQRLQSSSEAAELPRSSKAHTSLLCFYKSPELPQAAPSFSEAPELPRASPSKPSFCEKQIPPPLPPLGGGKGGAGKGEGGSCCKRNGAAGGWGGVVLPQVEAVFWRFFEFCSRCKFHPKCKNTLLKKSRNGSPALALCYEWQKNTKPTNQGSYDFTTFAKHLKTKTSISKNRKS